jgi:hypothetical protein
MRENVKIHHPITGGEATVDKRAVPIWRNAGWLEEGEEPPAAPPPTPPVPAHYILLARGRAEADAWLSEHDVAKSAATIVTAPRALQGLVITDDVEVVTLPGFETNPHKDEVLAHLEVVRATTPAPVPDTDAAAAGSSSTEK